MAQLLIITAKITAKNKKHAKEIKNAMRRLADNVVESTLDMRQHTKCDEESSGKRDRRRSKQREIKEIGLVGLNWQKKFPKQSGVYVFYGTEEDGRMGTAVELVEIFIDPKTGESLTKGGGWGSDIIYVDSLGRKRMWFGPIA